jgi:TetR/AcrR family transcriptional regulator, transcriptional repressor of bet genes
MPTPADRLLDAVTQVLLEDGFEGVSVRRVASLAGVSIGAVQHHFPTKDAMLNAAMDRASRQFQERLEAKLPSDPTAEQALRAVVKELLASDPDRHSDTVIWTQRLARAMVDQEMAARHAGEWQQVEDLISRLLGASRPQRSEAWARDGAAHLLAVLDGLAVSQVAEPQRMPAERAERIVAAVLTRLLESD